MTIAEQQRLARGRATPAPWLRSVQTAHSTLVVDYRTGAVTMLGGEAKHIWDVYVSGQQPDGPDVDGARIELVRGDFAQRGWLTAAPQPAPAVVRLKDSAASWGTQETSAALQVIGYTPWRWRLAGLPAVALIVLARQLGHRYRFARLLRLTKLGAGRPWATDQQVAHAVRAVRHAARILPARVACLEESVAAVVLLAARGRRARWCHGIATDPVRLHAWIAGRGGEPIEEPASTARYTVIN